MMQNETSYDNYFQHLTKISRLGYLYKRYFSSRLLHYYARKYGQNIVEIGAGVGNGVLGAFPESVVGIDINPLAVEYCKRRGMNAQLIGENGLYPFPDASFHACILDNVLEHIERPQATLDECWRITAANGGLVIAVPGVRGYSFDPDHKVFYDEEKLRYLDERWVLVKIFAMPSIILSRTLSNAISQYCIVAVYQKKQL